MAKITSINYNEITFDDGSCITYDHYHDCCENNYADFESVRDLVEGIDFDTHGMIFESVDGSGFRFGNKNNMIFVPCYSEQNGYYTSDLDIYFNSEIVISLGCQMVYD